MGAGPVDWENWKAQHPAPDDGNGDGGDENGFEDRRLRLGTTFGGARQPGQPRLIRRARSCALIELALARHSERGDQLSYTVTLKPAA